MLLAKDAPTGVTAQYEVEICSPINCPFYRRSFSEVWLHPWGIYTVTKEKRPSNILMYVFISLGALIGIFVLGLLIESFGPGGADQDQSPVSVLDNHPGRMFDHV